MSAVEGPRPDRVRLLAASLLPAAAVGVGSGLVLTLVYLLSDGLRELLWDAWPTAWGVSGSSSGWIVLILTLTGLAVGLVVWLSPGRAGPDPATQHLMSAPLPLAVLPGLGVALLLTLAGGPSLGPENPIIAIAVGLTVAAGARLAPSVTTRRWAEMATAGTIGAMFGTPVAAALVLTETATGDGDVPLWDRLFAPLTAAAAGALTTVLLSEPTLAITLTPYRGPRVVDLVTGSLIALVGAVVGLAGTAAFPYVHRFFHEIGHPLLMLVAGGFVLGLLGAVGGTVTLFKGLHELAALAGSVDGYGAAGLVLVVVVKLAALLVSAASGFPGGHIFPAIFLGGAIGLLANVLFPALPPALTVAAGVLGIVFAIARDGWLSLFIAVAVIGDVTVFPILVVASLPVWLLLTGRPEMVLPTRPATAP